MGVRVGGRRGKARDISGLELGHRSVVGVTPDLLGCGQENKQVDDAVLQGVEVLQGKGWGVLSGLDSLLQSASPPSTSECKGRGTVHTGHGSLRFLSLR